jgi:hypothetical protein
LAEIRELITSGTREDHKALTLVLVGPTMIEGRRGIQPSFSVPTQKVRVLSRVVHPAFHNKNLCGVVKAPAINLVPTHSKVRRGGYFADEPPR